MIMSLDSNDDFVFSDELDLDELELIEDHEEGPLLAIWKILVVDDDEDVHLATENALADVELLGKGLYFLHAYSVAECVDVLALHPDVAVILLDVVMETQHAGLKLADKIRRELNLAFPRIILRTGQPGYAPELDAIRKYDINDYKTKSELTRNKLYTTVLASIRAYDQLIRMEAHRQGLEQIVQGCSELIVETGLQSFAAGVIRQLAAILGTDPEGLLCAQANLENDQPVDDYIVIAAAGRYQAFIQHHLDEIDDPQIRNGLRQCFHSGKHLFEKDYLVLHFALRSNKQFAVFVKSSQPPHEVARELLKVFCSNVSVCADNINLINRLKDFAYLDKLVLLPNRTAFIETINQCFREGNTDFYSVILLDIDHFAEINNAFGHPYGDRLLIEFANRLNREFGQQCMISRISGDAFAMLGYADYVLPERIRPIMQRPFYIDDMEYAVAFSTGVVCLKDSDNDGQAVLKDANIARKLAREAGNNKDAIYSPDIGFRAKERTELLQQLQLAFTHNRLFPVFQPQVNIKDGQLLGFEALMRWRNEDGLFIPPERFIPLAEQSGFIVSMGAWILRHSLCVLRQLDAEGWKNLQMSVNVSAVQFRNPDFLATLQKAIDDTGVDPKCLELEITESVAMMGQELVNNNFRRIRELGVGIAIDDFGTGFSSLSYLDSLPLDRIKIDRSFITNICAEHDGRRIADVVIQLGHSLGLRVIAEGVENAAQAAQLLNLGCHEVQGYFYGHPMTADELRAWLPQWNPGFIHRSS